MTLRLDSTLASFESAAFAPTGDIVLTATVTDPLANPSIAILTSNLDPDDTYQVITIWHPAQQPTLKLSTAKSVKLKMSRNIAGGQVRVWDNA